MNRPILTYNGNPDHNTAFLSAETQNAIYDACEHLERHGVEFFYAIKNGKYSNGDLVISGSFCKMDDSCPATLTFYYNIPENQGYIKGRAINKATRLFWNKNKRELIEQATNLKNFMRLAEQAYNTALDGLTTFKEETAYTAVDYWKKKNSLSDDDYSFLLNEYELEKRIIDL